MIFIHSSAIVINEKILTLSTSEYRDLYEICRRTAASEWKGFKKCFVFFQLVIAFTPIFINRKNKQPVIDFNFFFYSNYHHNF